MRRISFWSLDYVFFFDSLYFVFLFLIEPEEEMVGPLQRLMVFLSNLSFLEISFFFFHHLIWVPFGLGVGDWIQGHVHVRSMLYQWASPTVYNDLITSRLHFFSSFLYPSLPPSLPLSLSYIRTQPSCPGFLISVGLYCVISFLLPHSSSPPFMRHGLSLRIRLGWNLAILLS